ncbi:MAG: CBS domain-containing protein [Leptolyngbyaceae cyanobacterium SM1_3_5]|nr:CBS domain-containing protein [Leptolyngbyaceae cyanobacterium SM1_3_5]
MATTVADLMTRDPVVVQPETGLKEVIKILAEKSIGGLPVVDSSGAIVGVISESDLMWQETGATPPPYIMLLDAVIYLGNTARYEQELHKAFGQTVSEVMTKEAITTTGDRTIKEAAQLMHDRRVRRLPVVDEGGKVVGILTRSDIIRFMANRPD